DLTGHDAIRLREDGKAPGPVRGVRSGGAPDIAADGALPGLRTADHLPVYGTRPRVDLPPFLGAAPQRWRVVVRRSGDREIVADNTFESAEVTSYLDPFDDHDPGLLGRFEIEISEHGRSATGSTHSHLVFVA